MKINYKCAHDYLSSVVATSYWLIACIEKSIESGDLITKNQIKTAIDGVRQILFCDNKDVIRKIAGDMETDEKECDDNIESNSNTFSDLFESIETVLCMRDQTHETIDKVSFACRSFVEAAKNADGKCLDLGIDVFSKAFGLPNAAVRAEVQEAKENK